MSSLQYKRALFIFHRDLRLEDNTALVQVIDRATEVVPCFIFDDRQVEEHEYFSRPALKFMIESLRDLSTELSARGGRLFLFRGRSDEVLGRLIPALGIDALASNSDYTPFAKRRDADLAAVCRREKVEFLQADDALLHAPHEVLKADGTPYTVFTPYFKRAAALSVRRPQKLKVGKFFTGTVPEANSRLLESFAQHCLSEQQIVGGRAACKTILATAKRYATYEETRDLPALDATSHLSVHLKFGTCSAREIYHSIAGKLGAQHPLLRQLHWRDFFTQIGAHFPRVFAGPFRREYEAIEWDDNRSHFAAWCEGRTGFPIVDAGMRELNATGFMHNRVRMITGSFLVKDLHIDWRRGERYFAQHLVDYDPAVNNGNWQWVASTGCDSQPYFRIFNPWLQQKKFDAECEYIRRWVPELGKISNKHIHVAGSCPERGVSGYPQPIVDHTEQRARTQRMYDV